MHECSYISLRENAYPGMHILGCVLRSSVCGRRSRGSRDTPSVTRYGRKRIDTLLIYRYGLPPSFLSLSLSGTAIVCRDNFTSAPFTPRYPRGIRTIIIVLPFSLIFPPSFFSLIRRNKTRFLLLPPLVPGGIRNRRFEGSCSAAAVLLPYIRAATFRARVLVFS